MAAKLARLGCAVSILSRVGDDGGRGVIEHLVPVADADLAIVNRRPALPPRSRAWLRKIHTIKIAERGPPIVFVGE
jgi:hypothetical protein